MLGAIGIGLQVIGGGMNAVGAFYGAKSRQNELKSNALDLEYQSRVANLNARTAEEDAQWALQEGQQQAAQLGLEYGQAKSQNAASIGASGILAGQGSTAEVQASLELAKAIDRRNIDLMAVRRANASRGQAVDYRNQANLTAVSARNMRRTASTINPRMAAFTSLLGSAAGIASSWMPSASAAGSTGYNPNIIGTGGPRPGSAGFIGPMP